MSTSVKGFFKGLRHITQIFDESKDIQIGFPTDVKHVAHIGSDGPAANAPSWMSDFKPAENENGQVISRRDDNNNNATGEGVGLKELLPPLEKPKKKKSRRKSEGTSQNGSPPRRRSSNVSPSDMISRPSRRHNRSRHASLDSSNDPSIRRRRVVSVNDEEGSNHLSDTSSTNSHRKSTSRQKKVKGSGGGEVSMKKTKAKPEKSTAHSDGICNDNNTSAKDENI